MSAENNSRSAELDEFKLYTLTELEGVLGVSHRTLLTYVKQGRLKAVKAGGKWKVTKEQLKAFIEGAQNGK